MSLIKSKLKLHSTSFRESPVFRELVRRAVLYLASLLFFGGLVALIESGDDRLILWLLNAICLAAITLSWRTAASSPRFFLALNCLMAVMVTTSSVAVTYGYPEQRVWGIPFYLIWILLLPTKVVVLGALTVTGVTAHFAGLQPVPENILLGIASAIVVHFAKKQISDHLRLATQDSLTGSQNRHYLPVRLAERFAAYRREKSLSSLVVFDIDSFKTINDEYGHGIGDEVLKYIVKTILSRIRATDTLFRFGGDEFVLVLTDVGATDAQKAMDQICSALKTQRPNDLPCFSLSCGICCVDTASSPEDWLERADLVAYEVKRDNGGAIGIAKSYGL